MLIRLNSDSGAIFINPDTVASIYRSGERGETSVVEMIGAHAPWHIVHGLPDAVHAALFPLQDEKETT